jgi:hypothetical protein
METIVKAKLRTSLAASILVVLAVVAMGSAPVSQTDKDAWAAALVTVNEAGLKEGSEDDAHGIISVLINRAKLRGVSVHRMALMYSGKAFEHDRPRRRWIAYLTPSGDEPRGWPKHYPNWDSHYKPAWLARIELARKLISGELEPCEAHHWGSRYHPVDQSRAQRALADGRWEVYECGDTKNEFYRVKGVRVPD